MIVQLAKKAVTRTVRTISSAMIAKISSVRITIRAVITSVIHAKLVYAKIVVKIAAAVAITKCAINVETAVTTKCAIDAKTAVTTKCALFVETSVIKTVQDAKIVNATIAGKIVSATIAMTACATTVETISIIIGATIIIITINITNIIITTIMEIHRTPQLSFRPIYLVQMIPMRFSLSVLKDLITMQIFLILMII